MAELKITFKMGEEVERELNTLQEGIGAKDKSEVLARALALLTFCNQFKDENGSITINGEQIVIGKGKE